MDAPQDLVSRIKSDLLTLEPSLFVMRWLLDRTPHVFAADAHSWAEWKLLFAAKLGLDACSIHIIGSAGAGVSFNPDNDFSIFNDQSDIDIAVISPFHFEHAWRTIRRLDFGGRRLSAKQRQSLKEHREKYIFWGTIATDRLLGLMPFGKEWLDVLSEFSTYHPMEDRDLKVRLYKDHESLIGYHASNVRGLRQLLLTPPEDITDSHDIATEN